MNMTTATDSVVNVINKKSNHLDRASEAALAITEIINKVKMTNAMRVAILEKTKYAILNKD